ncbi:DUF3732 domain-containing protein [Flavicella sediminum]|uniref:DUF3732 domain-containing protein n=1 Tax=Flavicella sediminum TaxID=2585141 RepID=UPI00112331C7|nr:DUF3732 domain-containing protein [Flavicella sediminum]
MQLYIKNIILYPKNHKFSPKILTFKEDKINIITGYSQRGKSAIIDIIDYCLASSDCDIPIGTIRNKVEVFALYLKFNDEYIFLGRENFEESKSTMYFYKESEPGERKSLRTNEWLNHKNEYKANKDYIKKMLNDMAGFKNIASEKSTSNNFNGPASFRDTAAFQFQTQNIIANPSTMFYKTDTWEHLQKLKTVFPLILGYKSYEILELEKEIQELETVKNNKLKKFEEIKLQYNSWQSDIYEFYSEAIQLGLTASDIDISTSTVDTLNEELSKIILNSKKGFLYNKGAANRFSEKARELSQKRNELTRELGKLKTNSYKIQELNNSKDEYFIDVVSEKENRLKPVEWFLKQKGTNQCPFCDSKSTKAIEQLLSLNDEKADNKIILGNSKSLTLSFENEKSAIIQEIKTKEELLVKLDSNLNILLSEIKVNEKSYQKSFEFIGKIIHALENLKKISPSGNLEEEIIKIKIEINTKKRTLTGLKSKFDKETSLEKLTNTIGKYTQLLPIEDKKTKKVHLDPDQSINIKIEDTITRDKHFLSRLGSGANHMSYHIATILGLHHFFNKLQVNKKPNYIPSFIVFDQPSQVYYPDQEKLQNIKEDSKDFTDTKKIFETCVAFMKNTNQNIQVIILEHVSKTTWSGIDDKYFHQTAEWRGKENTEEYDALIPMEWL